jgi:hypothetical protein
MIINLEQARADIVKWIIDFVEVPNSALGGWPPCPYAKKARIDNDFDVRIGSDPRLDLEEIAQQGLGGKSVVVIVYDPVLWPHDQFSKILEQANQNCLLSADIIVLEDHPDDLEIVNGICMNQGTYALALVQSLGDLDKKSKAMARQGFYNSWPEEYLQSLFKHRQDPRT